MQPLQNQRDRTRRQRSRRMQRASNSDARGSAVPTSDRASLSTSPMGVGKMRRVAGLEAHQAQNQDRRRKSKGVRPRHMAGAKRTRTHLCRGLSFNLRLWLPSPGWPSGATQYIAAVQGGAWSFGSTCLPIVRRPGMPREPSSSVGGSNQRPSWLVNITHGSRFLVNAADHRWAIKSS